MHTLLDHRGLDLPRTMLRPIKMAQCARPAGMGRKSGGVARCRWCADTVTFVLVMRLCSVCKREGGEFLKGLCVLFYELGLYVWFL